MNPASIRVDLDFLRHSLSVAVAAHTEEIGKIVDEELARVLVPETIAKMARDHAAQSLEYVVRAAVDESLRTAIGNEIRDVMVGAAAEGARSVLARLRDGAEKRAPERTRASDAESDRAFGNRVVDEMYGFLKGDGPEPYAPAVADLVGRVRRLIEDDRARR